MDKKGYSEVIKDGGKEVGLKPPIQLCVYEKQHFSFICQKLRSAADEAVQKHLKSANTVETNIYIEHDLKQCFVRPFEFWLLQLKVFFRELTNQSTLDQSVDLIAATFSAVTLPSSQE